MNVNRLMTNDANAARLRLRSPATAGWPEESRNGTGMFLLGGGVAPCGVTGTEGQIDGGRESASGGDA